MVLAFAAVIGAVAIYVQKFHPYGGTLFWPAIFLSRLGVSHSWTLIPLAFGAWIFWIARKASRHGWLRFALVTAISVASYCIIARSYLVRAVVPAPGSERFPEDSKKSLAYREAYAEGYRDGMFGIMMTYCFRPETETIGCYEGARDGYQTWCRVWGRTLSDKESHFFRSSAAIDGVALPK